MSQSPKTYKERQSVGQGSGLNSQGSSSNLGGTQKKIFTSKFASMRQAFGLKNSTNQEREEQNGSKMSSKPDNDQNQYYPSNMSQSPK
jgi:hypothetical protein